MIPHLFCDALFAGELIWALASMAGPILNQWRKA
jgi:hypothetical protein